MAEYGNKDDLKCPECGEMYEVRMRNLHGDSRCKSGHEWHVCLKHQVVAKGRADYACYGGRNR